MYIIPYCLFKMVDFQWQNDTSKRVALHHPNDTIQENCRWWPFKRDPPTNSSCTKSGCVCFLKLQRFKSSDEYTQIYIYIYVYVYNGKCLLCQCPCNSSPFFLWRYLSCLFFPTTRYSTKRPLKRNFAERHWSWMVSSNNDSKIRSRSRKWGTRIYLSFEMLHGFTKNDPSLFIWSALVNAKKKRWKKSSPIKRTENQTRVR